MFQEIIHSIPTELVYFLLTVLFSLLIGLEQRRHHNITNSQVPFGTDRTFTLIGVLGFVLYVLDQQHWRLFLGGGFILTVILGIFYFKRIEKTSYFGFTSLINGLLTYCIAPLIYTQPNWLVLLIVVTILIVTEIKDDLRAISQKFDNGEFITLGKFLVFAGVILPLLPNKPLWPNAPITPYHFWLSIVIVSSISYFSYLLQKFVFPKSGPLLTGLLGGLYSSTATIIILAKKTKNNKNSTELISAATLAIAMMYVRILIIAFIIDQNVAKLLLFKIIVMVFFCLLSMLLVRKWMKNNAKKIEHFDTASSRNPLEFKTALVFGILFLFFSITTHYVLTYFGNQGLQGMSILVGVTDIDPFILNLLQGKWNIEQQQIAAAIFIAINSNNILKMIYSFILSSRDNYRAIAISFGLIIAAGILFTFVSF